MKIWSKEETKEFWDAVRANPDLMPADIQMNAFFRQQTEFRKEDALCALAEYAEIPDFDREDLGSHDKARDILGKTLRRLDPKTVDLDHALDYLAARFDNLDSTELPEDAIWPECVDDFVGRLGQDQSSFSEAVKETMEAEAERDSRDDEDPER